MQQIKDGRNLEPRVLGDESHSLGESANIDKPVIALNFIEAADFRRSRENREDASRSPLRSPY